ncbi:MAG: TIGR04076 family protein [Bacteroidetes bacterium]|nr:TIGR04076 family protein [Bacteroidota bacterium]
MDIIDTYCRREFIKRGIGYGLAAGCCGFLGKPTGSAFASKNIMENKSNQEHQKKEDGQKMKCKITVLRKMFNQDYAENFCQESVTSCPVFTEGQAFIYDHSGDGSKPSKFCERAWNDIYPTVMTLAHNGTFLGWMKEDGISIACCTDGIRPVVFKIERISDA